MGVPEVTLHAPSPRVILGQNVVRHEGLILDDQRNPDEIGKEPGVNQSSLEVINDE